MSGAGVVLIGLRRSGKSSVGRALAAALGCPFVDLDEVVRDLTGLAPAAIIECQGEPAFRAVERQAVLRCVTERDSVIATGGGTPMDDENSRRLARHGTVIYLQVTPDALRARAAGDPDPATRPVLAGGDAVEEVAILHRERNARYAQLADVVIDAGPAVERVTDACLAALRRHRDV